MVIGLEQVIIYMFSKELGWTVTNPCKILKIYHQHQVAARKTLGERANKPGKNSAYAPRTDKLL